jgi:hypothetical protein
MFKIAFHGGFSNVWGGVMSIPEVRVGTHFLYTTIYEVYLMWDGIMSVPEVRTVNHCLNTAVQSLFDVGWRHVCS